MKDFNVLIPDVGEAKDVEVIEICVNVGDSVSVDDALLVIESDKASMEVPCPVEGNVQSINVEIGDIIDTGDLVAVLGVSESTTKEDAESAEFESPESDVAENIESENQEHSAPDPIVGDGEKSFVTRERFEVRLPELGDVDDVEVIEVLVQQGDLVQLDQPLVVLESDKATMELPAPIAGMVEQLMVGVGDQVTDNSLIAVLAGEEPEKPQDVSLENSPTIPTDTQVTKSSTKDLVNVTAVDRSKSAAVYAGPATRRLARELGVDLTQVEGSGVRGRIVKDDVKQFVKAQLQQPAGEISVGIPDVDYPDFTKFGETELVPLSRMQARGADNLVRSWLNVVHVTQHDEADVTGLEEFRVKLNAEDSAAENKLTLLPFVLKACAATLREHTRFNASITKDLKSLILKKYINIGMAVDTPEGLIVPVIQDVLEKGLRDLAVEIETLSTAAREKKLTVEQISGASFTVSSLGRLGGTGFTPIINAPEVAILGVARLSTKPVWHGAEFEPRSVLPLSLSYDHRAINGAEGGRFMQSLIEKLQDVRHLIL